MKTKQDILSSLLINISCIEDALREYTQSFDEFSSYSFNISKDEYKKRSLDYRSTTSKLLTAIDKTDEDISSLASLLCFADRSMDTEETLILSGLLDDSLKWKNTLLEAMTDCDALFSKPEAFRVSAVLLAARRALTATEILKGKLKK